MRLKLPGYYSEHEAKKLQQRLDNKTFLQLKVSYSKYTNIVFLYTDRQDMHQDNILSIVLKELLSLISYNDPIEFKDGSLDQVNMPD